MKFGVVRFPGSNCDDDCYYVLKNVLNQETVFLWHKDTDLQNCDCIVLPGGFSYGDYLRCGAIARFSPIMNSIIKFANNGGYVIGICNGFQILLEAGLLPGAMKRNNCLTFVCKYVKLRVDNINTPFTNKFKKDQVIRVPVAHGEGNYYIDPDGLKQLDKNSQAVFRYANGDASLSQDINPNGSVGNIAGIINKAGNVLGMMPHPERCSEAILLGEDGRLIFESLIARG